MPTADLPIRELTEADTEAAGRLAREAFGFPTDPGAVPWPVASAGRRAYGAFDGDRLVAKVVDREFHSWFGGVAVPTAGIAGVTVAVEHRGRGLLAPLFAAALGGARERGVLVSGLFPTQPGIYRRLGYELVTALETAAVPTSLLASVAAPVDITLRRASVEDVGAIADCYQRWARAQNGPLTRRGGSYPDPAADFESPTLAVTVAERAGELLGYACWERGQHVGERAVIEVEDLVAVDAGALRALLRALGSSASVAPVTRIETTGDDLARLVLPGIDWRVTESHPYMIMITDVAGLLSTIGYAAGLEVEVGFTVRGDQLIGTDGGYRLAVSGGSASCARLDEPAEAAPVFHPRGLSLVVSGAQSCANVRFAGLLTGPDDHDRTLDALFGGRQVQIRDYY